MLPDFLVIGAYKAGTTSLYHYLRQHPQIHMSPVKETRYLTWRGHQSIPLSPLELRAVPWPVRSLEAYRELFAAAEGTGKLCGEVSPSYLAFPEQSIQGISELVPSTKLIVVLRDPVRRAYSSYVHLVGTGKEDCLDFRKALDLEMAGVPRKRDGAPRRNIVESFYYDSLRAYFDRFPADQILVCLYDDWNGPGPDLLQRVFRFLGIREDFLPADSRRANISLWPNSTLLHQAMSPVLNSLPRNLKKLLPGLNRKPPARMASPYKAWKKFKAAYRRLNGTTPPNMASEDVARLRRLYRPDVERLQSLLGRDLSAWLD